MPSAPKKPTQNWWVDQRLRTRGIPTRRSARDDAGVDFGAGAAERVLPNHLGNVRVVTLDLLELRLDDAQLVGVLDEPLGARVAADHALPAGQERQLAPGSAGRARDLDIDERARAVDRAPLADGRGAGRRLVDERLDGIEAAKPGGRAGPAPVGRAQRRADRAGFAGVRMQNDLRLRDLDADEVDMSLHHR